MNIRGINIQSKRKEMAYFFNNSSLAMTKLVPHPVKEKNLTINLGQSKAILLIGDMDDKDIVLIIINILEEIKTLENSQEENHPIHACLIFFKNINIRQAMSVQEIINFLSNVEKIKEELTAFVAICQQIKIISDTVNLHKELIVYLEGLYFHFYKDKDSFFDKDNFGLKFATKGELSKIIIANYYQLAADVIQSQINEYISRVAIEQVNPLEKIEAKIEIKDVIVNEIADKTHEIENTNISNMTVEVTEILNEACLHPIENQVATIIPKNEIANDEIQAQRQEQFFGKILYESYEDVDQIKIQSLYNAITTYHLTTNQAIRLAYLKPDVLNSLDSYIDNTYLKRFIGEKVSGVIFPRTHWQLATNTIADIHQTEDRQKILNILYDLHLTLRRTGSNELNSIVEKTLLGAYTMLLNMYQSQSVQKETLTPMKFFKTVPSFSKEIISEPEKNTHIRVGSV